MKIATFILFLFASAIFAQEAPSSENKILIEKQLTGVFSRLVAPLDNSLPEITIGEVLQGKVDDDDVVACEKIKVFSGPCKILKSTVEEITVVFEHPALNLKNLLNGKLKIVGDIKCHVFIKINKNLIENKLKLMNIKNISVVLEDDIINIGGRVSYMFMDIAFRIKGHLELMDQNVGFLVESLSIRGSPASESRKVDVQKKFKSLILIGEALKGIGLDNVKIESADISVKE